MNTTTTTKPISQNILNNGNPLTDLAGKFTDQVNTKLESVIKQMLLKHGFETMEQAQKAGYCLTINKKTSQDWQEFKYEIVLSKVVDQETLEIIVENNF